MMIKISLLKYTIRLEKCEYSIDTSIKFLYNNKIFATVKFLYTNSYVYLPSLSAGDLARSVHWWVG